MELLKVVVLMGAFVHVTTLCSLKVNKMHTISVYSYMYIAVATS